MINPGTAPLDDAQPDVAAANLEVFLTAVRDRVPAMGGDPLVRTAELSGDPVRDPAADRDGRFGWDLPFSDGSLLRVLMPGVELSRLRDDISAQAPCLYVNGTACWWNDAVARVAAEGLRMPL
ncbi:hypothetical protein [Actinoplanes sp. N902-109]|uniref:hypothetical protein n=1 Tax=Actinoplanes sp. (strain N902-109) TaxID=649831 RepID=UPI00032945E0|nr:hypothetical protein [Actinoplanes sp. N902-109]AGL14290.1 hypothetical protein L083_0780 [Actinoplanes sp. N902-109]